ncbi:MAG: helix-turn-helix transcriptional regulator [Pseudomonadota bacterium]
MSYIDTTSIIVLETQNPTKNVICQALRHTYPQAGILGACLDEEMERKLDDWNVMAIVMDWQTSKKPWQDGSVADYIREFYPNVMMVIVDGHTAIEMPVCDIRLTRRERDVLGLLRYGARNQDIADQIGVKLITIKLHVRSLCRKVEVKNRTQLALWANEVYYPSQHM